MRILPRLIENILFCTLLYFLIYKNKLFVRKSFRNLEEHVFLSGYSPPYLPLLIRFEEHVCIHKQIIKEIFAFFERDI